MESLGLSVSKVTGDEKSMKSSKSLLTTVTPEIPVEIKGKHHHHHEQQQQQLQQVLSGVLHATQEPYIATDIVHVPEAKWNNRDTTATESGRVTPVPDADTVEQSNSIEAEATKSAFEEADVSGSGEDDGKAYSKEDNAADAAYGGAADTVNRSEDRDYEMAEYGGISLDGSRQHHLLRHSLPSEQRGEGVLAHFGVDTISEAAKQIKKMSQRDLQAKFKAVYGARTFSNNNNWLRRKLFEAIGLDPSKGAVKKPGAGGGQRRRRSGVNKSAARAVRTMAAPRNSSPRIPRRSRMMDDLTDHTVAEALLALGDLAGLGEAVEGAGDSFTDRDVHHVSGAGVNDGGYDNDYDYKEKDDVKSHRLASSEQGKRRVAVLQDFQGRGPGEEDHAAPSSVNGKDYKELVYSHHDVSVPLPVLHNNHHLSHHRHQQDAGPQMPPQMPPTYWDPEIMYEWMVRMQRHAMELNPPLPPPPAIAAMVGQQLGLEGGSAPQLSPMTSVVVPSHYPAELYHRMMHEAALAMSINHQVGHQHGHLTGVQPPALFAAQGQ